MPSNDKNQDQQDQNEAKESGTITLYITAGNKIYYGTGIPKYDDPNWIKETTWGSNGVRKILREHTTGEGIKPVQQIMVAVKSLNAERAKNPTMPDSVYQKKLSKIKGGEINGQKIETLTIVIKPTDNASYKNMVDALDEMQILNIGTYVIDKISADDEKLLKSKGVKM